MNPFNSLLQWNCRGMQANLHELNLLIQTYTPASICLQETYVTNDTKISLVQYSLYHHYAKKTITRPQGGTTLAVHNSIPHSIVNITTQLQAVAVRLNLFRTITLCNLYLPPNSPLEVKELEDLTDQLPPPFIILGDFNAHSTCGETRH